MKISVVAVCRNALPTRGAYVDQIAEACRVKGRMTISNDPRL